ncbi:MAG TPA: hypothetical protein VMT00_17280 [Thermoanaerobaculia bacterium]|nr:hypothetical protein [Thermoanaerobaculia bacterium]
MTQSRTAVDSSLSSGERDRRSPAITPAAANRTSSRPGNSHRSGSVVGSASHFR